MKSIKILLVSVFAFLLFSTCKKESSSPSSREELLFQSFKMMESAKNRMIEIGDSMVITPPEALYYTSLWLQNQTGVEEAFTLDSAYLIIRMKSGFESTISIREIGPDGLDVYRGSGSGTAKLQHFFSSGGSCSNKIENKKVLVYAAYEHQFYSANEMKLRVEDMIKNSDVDVDLTILKNEECTIDAILTMNQYGLVILETHGAISGILTGILFTLTDADIPSTVDQFLDLIGSKIGSQHVQSMLDEKVEVGYAFEYDPQLQIQAQWDNYRNQLAAAYFVQITSKGIREMMPMLSNTIVFANACYSGFNATSWNRPGRTRAYTCPDPIKPAWMSRDPLTFWGYEAASDGVSYKAPNETFCKPNLDTLIQSLFYDGDSTGSAHLANQSGVPSILEFPWNEDIGSTAGDHGPLRFNQYESPQWCYGSCGDTITDSRDGQKYPTVCIGEQVWMAKNLNWAGLGVCYDNDPANCTTYGRLYTIAELTSNEASNANPSGVQGICPNGWHVPSKAEVDELIAFLGGNFVAAPKLCAPQGWTASGAGQITNSSGFSLLPGGNQTNAFRYMGEGAYLWTCSVGANQHPLGLVVGPTSLSIVEYQPPMAIHCRCVKD